MNYSLFTVRDAYERRDLFVRVAIVALVISSYALAQKPPIIQRDSVREVFDGKAITVRYGKPSLQGRKIFGHTVPYYKVWRTGSGAATELETEADLEMNGAIVPRGAYSLYTIPTETTWKLIINKQTGQWGTVYHSQYDLARLSVRPITLKSTVETLTFRIEKKSALNGVLVLEWENIRLTIPFHVSREPLVPSPRDEVSQTLNGVTMTINYGRPSVRGRKIFGGVVPYGIVWRTGANEATSMTITGDIWIGGNKVPRGSYTLYTLPTKRGWWLIINKQTGQWGTEYNKSMDLIRVPMTVRSLPHTVEKFTIEIRRLTPSKGELKLLWEKTEASIVFELKGK